MDISIRMGITLGLNRNLGLRSMGVTKGQRRRRAIAVLADSRTVLVVVGALSLLLAINTGVNYTTYDLPTKYYCIVALGATAIIGLGSIVVPPNRVTRRMAGLLIMANSVLRIIGFSLVDLRSTEGFFGFIFGTNAVWVWCIVFYLGFVIWARRNVEKEASKEAGDEP